jgi:osmotically-inducible protein OsmY
MSTETRARIGRPAKDGADQQTKACLERSLRQAPYEEIRPITCAFHEGVAILRGRVPSYFHKQLAQTIAMHAPGVVRVVNHVEVARPRISDCVVEPFIHPIVDSPGGCQPC